MPDLFQDLLPTWGIVLIAAFNAIGRCGPPLPSSALMLIAGATVITDVSHLTLAILTAYCAALIGDIAGYILGTWGGSWIVRLSERRPKVAILMTQAEGLAQHWGVWAVLFSRFPLSTVGPYVNLVAGAVRMPRLPFALFCLIGELVWVSLYLGLGYAFASNLDVVSAYLGRVTTGALVLAVCAAAYWLWRKSRQS